MKETLDEQSRSDLVKYRIERAKETLQEAIDGKGRLLQCCFQPLVLCLLLCLACIACKERHLYSNSLWRKNHARPPLCFQGTIR